MLCRRRLAVDGCVAKLESSCRHVTAPQITAFSHGYFRAEDIVNTERQVCRALTRRLPTTLALRGGGAVLEDAALRDRLPWPSSGAGLVCRGSLGRSSCSRRRRTRTAVNEKTKKETAKKQKGDIPFAPAAAGLIYRGLRPPWDARTVVLLEEKENQNSSK